MADNQAEVKAAMKDAIKEWMDEKFAEFGRWTFHGILIALLGALAYFILASHGWQPPAGHAITVPGIH